VHGRFNYSTDAMTKKQRKTNSQSPQRIEVGKAKIDKIVRSRRFDAGPSPEGGPTKGPRPFIFRWPGDEIEGTLGQPMMHIRRNTSYPIVLDDGSVRQIFGNKIDHQIIRDNELIGQRVNIRYIGMEQIPGVARMRKVKRWYLVKGPNRNLCGTKPRRSST